MKKTGKILKCILIIIAVIAAILLALYGVLVYILNYAVNTVDKSESPDGKYMLTLQSVGSPIFFSSADGKLVLTKGKKKITEYEFVLSDDGGSVRSDIWQVHWEDDSVTVVISGSEQDDEMIHLGFDGEVQSRRIAVRGDVISEQDETGTSEESNDSEEENAADEIGRQEESDNVIPGENMPPEDPTLLRIDEGYQKLYDLIFKEKNDSFIKDYDAKGNSRVILHEDEAEVEYLTYDRESENGKCGLYVYYRCEKNEDGSWSPMDASILDIYAYVYDSGEVISSGKKTWGDIPSDRYRRATGE